MMKKLTVLFLTLSLLLCGCAKEAAASVETVSASTETAAPTETSLVTVTDLVGREVEILPGSYEKVVCIGAGALRIYSYIGDVNLLAGVEDIDNTTLEERPKMFDSVARPYVLAYGDVFRTLPSCGVGGPMAQTAEAEKILSCDPDIVISQYEDADKANALQAQLGIPVITLKTGADGVFAPEFAASLELLGKVFAKEDRAAELTAFVAAETAEIQKRTEALEEANKEAAYICGLGNWGTTNHLMTSQNYKPFQIASIRNAVTGLSTGGVAPIEEETFVALGEGMGKIFIDAAAVKNIAPLYAEDPAMFDTCQAARTGEVYLQMAYNAYYTNYEISLANTWFAAKTMYPDVFSDIDMTEKLNQITETFLGAPLAEEIFACPSSFGGYQKIDLSVFFG